MTKTLVAGQSDALTEFYRAYLAWINSGAYTNHPNFVRYAGLCDNISDYFGGSGPGLRAADEMCEQFRQAGLDVELPFNLYPGQRRYSAESMSDLCHTNPYRIQWVRDHV